MRQGETRVEQGIEGVRSAVYRVTYKNGVETGRELVGSEIVQPATPTRYITGSAPPVNAAEPPVNSLQAPDFSGSYAATLTVRATWYNASHGGKAPSDPWYGYTATGVRLDKGICATDPNVIAMGTWMYIPGYGTCLAADVGGGVKGNHIDLGFPESAGSNPWATQTLEIYILE
jgi:3D (Asp-Asp-Asp) domain-containing protein